MTIPESFPKEVRDEHFAIAEAFDEILAQYEGYCEPIPQDNKLVKRILSFVIDVINFCVEQYDFVRIREYQTFLAQYEYEFLYGPSRDDSNYLDLEEGCVTEYFRELNTNERLTREQLLQVKERYCKVHRQLSH